MIQIICIQSRLLPEWFNDRLLELLGAVPVEKETLMIAVTKSSKPCFSKEAR